MAQRQLLTRRVTAQRKFAQGAFVPPNAVAVTNGAPERRETSSLNRDRSILRFSNMSMESTLDYLCFKNNHAHLQPIVLVERLPEQQPILQVNGAHSNLKARTMNGLPKLMRRRRLATRSTVHTMHLRSSDRSSNSKINRSTKSRITKTRNNVILNKRKIGAKGHKHKQKRKASQLPVYQFTVDDNRPLKYLASSNIGHSQSKSESVKRSNKVDTNAKSAIMNVPKVKTLKRSIGNAVSRKRRQPIGEICQTTLENENTELPQKNAVPESSNERESQMPFNASSSVNYYSEQGIHRWMDGLNLPKEPELPSQPPVESHETIIINDDEHIKNERCPSYAWRSVSEVVHLSKAEYMLRCSECVNCRRIEKYKTICDMLRNKFNICDNVESTQTINWNAMCSRHLEISKENSLGSHEVIITEMLPRHPHVMIKFEIRNINTKKIMYMHLIPRSRAEISIEFSFVDHEFILNQCMSMMINGDEEIIVKPNPEPMAGPSGLQKEPPSEVQNQNEECNENSGKILNAPTYHPTREEFADPMAYFEKISKEVSDIGICKIVLPDYFAPPCKIDDNIKFEVFNQYISRLYSRWGPAARELCAIQSCLKDNKVGASRAVIDGVEVNLPKLYHLVQHHGGFENVMNKNKWSKVAEDMNLNKGPSTGKKLDQIYVTFLLPYNALTPKERQDLFMRVEKAWLKRNERMLKRANNPLHHQKWLLGESDTSSDESDDDVTKDVEDCVNLGQSMNLARFKRVAKNAQHQFFKNKMVPPSQVEQEYWRMVICGTEHVCVNSASIDTGEQGIGFPTNKNDSYGNHKWNLKMLSQNKANILRSLGPVLGVTVPTLHLGMIFSSSCWHRDPHSVPWIEFQHTGPAKLWYSVPEKEGSNFCNSSKTLFPTSCQNKDLWLSSDISMIPPNLLAQQNVTVYRVEQNPGEFVLVMPRAYSCSICTGYTVSESVYFATESLLDGLVDAFKEIRKSCEPTMFALEQLLMAIAEDRTSPLSLLKKIQSALEDIIDNELDNRNHLTEKGVSIVNPVQETEESMFKGKKSKSSTSKPAVWNVRDLDECEICRCTLYLSKVKNISRNIFLCLEHALRVMANKKNPVSPEELCMHVLSPTEQLQELSLDLMVRMEQLEK